MAELITLRQELEKLLDTNSITRVLEELSEIYYDQRHDHPAHMLLSKRLSLLSEQTERRFNYPEKYV